MPRSRPVCSASISIASGCRPCPRCHVPMPRAGIVSPEGNATARIVMTDIRRVVGHARPSTSSSQQGRRPHATPRRLLRPPLRRPRRRTRSAHGERARDARPRCSGNRLPPRRQRISHDARPERGCANPRATSENRRQKGDRGAFRPDGPPFAGSGQGRETPAASGCGLVTRTGTTAISARVRRNSRTVCTTEPENQQPCGIPAPSMARPGLEPGTPRFSDAGRGGVIHRNTAANRDNSDGPPAGP
jgi:hypothetical protein